MTTGSTSILRLSYCLPTQACDQPRRLGKAINVLRKIAKDCNTKLQRRREYHAKRRNQRDQRGQPATSRQASKRHPSRQQHDTSQVRCEIQGTVAILISNRLRRLRQMQRRRRHLLHRRRIVLNPHQRLRRQPAVKKAVTADDQPITVVRRRSCLCPAATAIHRRPVIKNDPIRLHSCPRPAIKDLFHLSPHLTVAPARTTTLHRRPATTVTTVRRPSCLPTATIHRQSCPRPATATTECRRPVSKRTVSAGTEELNNRTEDHPASTSCRFISVNMPIIFRQRVNRTPRCSSTHPKPRTN